MSKVAKRPVAVPSGVEIKTEAGRIAVKGPKGTLDRPLPSSISVRIDGSTAYVERANNDKQTVMHHGTMRSHLANMVTGVTQGFQKVLILEGVGYRAAASKGGVQLTLGFSHPIEHKALEGVKIETPEPTRVIISGINTEKVGQTAAEIRRYRPPEPYKGKGIRYDGERIRRKAGKAAAK